VIDIDAKQYLKQAYRLNELIESDVQELDRLRDLASSISSSQFSDMPHSASRNTEAPFVKYVGRIIEMEQKIKSEIDRYVDLQNEIRETINKLKNNDEKLLLRYKYIFFMTWEEVAEKMNVSMRTVHRIHGNALNNLQVPK
jgi:DNA-directed RNA polymerase specialized sigma subunit